jgi:hypothetical protein
MCVMLFNAYLSTFVTSIKIIIQHGKLFLDSNPSLSIVGLLYAVWCKGWLISKGHNSQLTGILKED